MNNTFPPHISPLVRRHAEDAGFYWAQHDASGQSPRLTLPGLGRFSHLLSAHLEGLAVAGTAAWDPAVRALERWKKPAEAFVCASVMFAKRAETDGEQFWRILAARPDQLLRGAISALAWLPAPLACDAIRTLGAPEAPPIHQTVTLRALGLLDCVAQEALPAPPDHFLRSDDRHVRAAAWRLASALPFPAIPDRMFDAAFDDSALPVRAEAAIALGRHCAAGRQRLDGAATAGAALAGCVVAQAGIVGGASGWDHTQASRRLVRYVRWLGALLPVGDPAVPPLLEALPPRAGLALAACHGDPATLPFVVERMADEELSRFAGWAWETVTGIDLRGAGLSVPESDTDQFPPAVSEARLDADQGLPLPDPVAIRRHAPAGPQPGQRSLLGHPTTPAHALAVIESRPQAQRSIALCHLQLRFPQLRMSVRAPAARQALAIDAMRSMLRDGLHI